MLASLRIFSMAIAYRVMVSPADPADPMVRGARRRREGVPVAKIGPARSNQMVIKIHPIGVNASYPTHETTSSAKARFHGPRGWS